MTKNNLKLFLWLRLNIFKIYQIGIDFAIAENEKEARKLISKKRGYELDVFLGTLFIFDLTEKMAFFKDLSSESK